MDHAQRDKLSELVEELTTSGEPQLNPNKLKEVKKICKVSNDYIEHFYHLTMTQLAQDHAEIRLSAFQMVSELFTRSHHFRVLLVDNFQEFLDLTVETDSDEPLPPPKEVARKLKTIAIKTVQEWQATYGEAYKKLALGYHFLKQVKKVDFHDVQARTLAERKREEERQKRLERIYKDKVEKATKEMEDASEEIEECLTEINNCIKLLLPAEFDLSDLDTLTPANNSTVSVSSVPNEKASTSSDLDEQPCCSKDLELQREPKNPETSTATKTNEEKEEEDPSDEDSDIEDVLVEDAFIRNTGLISHKYSLDLNLSTDLKLKETEENEAVVNTMKDLHKLLSTKHLPVVQYWVQVFTKAGVPEPLLRRAIDLKSSLERALQKHEDLHIDYKARHRRVMKAPEGSDDDDDDFEEVPEKEGFEPHIPDHLREEYGLEPSPSTSVACKKPVQPPVKCPATGASHTLSRPRKRATDEEQDPTCAAATLRLFKQRLLPQPPSTSSAAGGHVDPTYQASEDRDKAPVIPFGLDLYYWGEEQPTAGKIIKNSSQHQFWVPNEVEEEVENKELAAQMKSRYITFAGRFQPVKHRCKTPMSNGGLCERQDRVKCPFHGPIIPRDELGKPTNPEDAVRLEKEEWKRREDQPDWRDPELMRDIELATGEDLGSSKTFGKGKKGKGKGKKKKYPNLSDLKKGVNTSRSRLEKKVFNPSSMRRVTDVMNKMDKLKHAKFANQFNYALN